MLLQNEALYPADSLHDEDVSTTNLHGNILVVDDCSHGRELISRLLRRVGLSVETADNGLEACHRALTALKEGQPFDLILTDMDMPVMDGYSATKYLRELGYSGRIAALTATSNETARKECLAAGCDDFATKPITLEMLLDLARRNLQANSLPIDFRTARAAASASRLPPAPTLLCA